MYLKLTYCLHNHERSARKGIFFMVVKDKLLSFCARQGAPGHKKEGERRKKREERRREKLGEVLMS